MRASYDIVIVGGGLAGAGLAWLMASQGARVLVLERTAAFHDRVRGEVLVPWGVADAQRLGLEPLLAPVANELRSWEIAVAGTTLIRRDIIAAGALGLPILTYYHPTMQAIVLAAAADAGAEVRRAARVTGVEPGCPAAALFDDHGRACRVTARLVAGADGRGSAVRGWGGFVTRRDPGRRLFAGVLFDDVRAPEDVLYSGFLPGTGLMTYVFPQGRGRVRSYIGFAAGTDVERFQGDGDLARFVTTAQRIGVPPGWYGQARAAGPLATFDATDEWVTHPYGQGVALVGDAAATSDPTWGQGMSLTLRDLRLLRDTLLATDDWDRAGHAYAARHDEVHREVHRADGWYTDLFLAVGPEADARRERALPLLIADPGRIPDTPLGGPEIAADEGARRRFFGEDMPS